MCSQYDCHSLSLHCRSYLDENFEYRQINPNRDISKEEQKSLFEYLDEAFDKLSDLTMYDLCDVIDIAILEIVLRSYSIFISCLEMKLDTS